MVLLAGVIFLGVLELLVILYSSIISEYSLSNHEILQIFGYFLLILIGIELLETIKVYLLKHEIYVEIIVLVAIIAVARKIILLDPFIEGSEMLDTGAMIALGVVIIALSASYYLIRRSAHE
jgi:uncharacterized membrane protein (DUF373 family)